MDGPGGGTKPNPDCDIAVFIEGAGTSPDAIPRLAAVSTDILLDTGTATSATPFLAGAYPEDTGFLHEQRKDRRDP
jgi:hypothetical protein